MQLADHIKVKRCRAARCPLRPRGMGLGAPPTPPAALTAHCSFPGSCCCWHSRGVGPGARGGVWALQDPFCPGAPELHGERCPPRGKTERIRCLKAFSWRTRRRSSVLCRGSEPMPEPRAPCVPAAPSCPALHSSRRPFCAPQFTQSALDCMGVEVCRLRAFLQVGAWAGLRWAPPPLQQVAELLSLPPGWAGGVRPGHPAQGPGDLMQRHPAVLQEDPAPHAGHGRAGHPRSAGLRAAGGQRVAPALGVGAWAAPPPAHP